MHQEKNEERDMAFLKLTLDFGCRKKGKKNKMFPLTLFFVFWKGDKIHSVVKGKDNNNLTFLISFFKTSLKRWILFEFLAGNSKNFFFTVVELNICEFEQQCAISLH